MGDYAMNRKIGRFKVRAADHRGFNVNILQQYEELATGRGKKRLVPSIQVMETDEGYYVRRVDENRLLICGPNVYVTRE